MSEGKKDSKMLMLSASEKAKAPKGVKTLSVDPTTKEVEELKEEEDKEEEASKAKPKKKSSKKQKRSEVKKAERAAKEDKEEVVEEEVEVKEYNQPSQTAAKLSSIRRETPDKARKYIGTRTRW
ncbi:MAG: hypothetical protein CL489_10880 [Acidobacteria bacterium]|nr:hypothetical protein [Acidobacteriota bacterium]|tara:strand:+ start:15569 stop:15940 length:372 start_codon:yes stop_codon:yes gene_type:complete